MVMYIGEALVGEGNEIAHIDLIVGSKDGPGKGVVHPRGQRVHLLRPVDSQAQDMLPAVALDRRGWTDEIHGGHSLFGPWPQPMTLPAALLEKDGGKRDVSPQHRECPQEALPARPPPGQVR